MSEPSSPLSLLASHRIHLFLVARLGEGEHSASRAMKNSFVIHLSRHSEINICRFLYRQKAAEKPLLPIVFACYGGPNAAPGAYSRVCKQTGPCADAFSPSSAGGSDIGAEFI